jgi:RNA polymerase sigma-70 factor (ECF subfamily)
LLDLLPARVLRAEVQGLLALMLLQDARKLARSDANGDLVLLEHQNRSLWNSEQISRGLNLVAAALRQQRFGVFTLQAAIAAVHAEAATYADTDWRQIAGLYDVLLRLNPSPVIALNRAVAVAMVQGPLPALALVDGILHNGDLADYHLSHAVRADFLRQLNRNDEAVAAYRQALALARQLPEQRFLQQRLAEMAAL